MLETLGTVLSLPLLIVMSWIAHKTGRKWWLWLIFNIILGSSLTALLPGIGLLAPIILLGVLFFKDKTGFMGAFGR